MALPSTIDAVILAGGQGSRLGGVDKGLLDFQGKPVALHLRDLILSMPAFQGHCMISANRNLSRYQTWFKNVLTDEELGYPGPLAGIVAALAATQADALLVVPCDVPLLPANLLERLREPFSNPDCLASYVVTDDGPQPTLCLLRTELHAMTRARLLRQERQLRAWLAACQSTPVYFANSEAFRNFNLPQDWQGL